MRDGTKLHTVVDFPLNKPKTNLTVVMDRSPYGMYALEMISDIYTIWGFAAVRQDMRGTQQSDGTFSIWHSAANDSYDTMQWISQQPWSNGEVYTVGASADGLASFEMLRDSPPWLKKQFIIFASGVGYPIAFPGGAFRQALDVLWLNSTVPSQGTELIHTLEEHEAHDSWWAPLSGVGEWQKVKWPTVMFAGWCVAAALQPCLAQRANRLCVASSPTDRYGTCSIFTAGRRRRGVQVMQHPMHSRSHSFLPQTSSWTGT